MYLSRPKVPTSELPNEVGDFTLTERDGTKVGKAEMLGKVSLAGFVFTRCTGPCPRGTGPMARLQKELADVADFRLVTFTVDPEHDGPAELTAYARQYQAEPGRWLFLTGPVQEIRRVLTDEFHVHRVEVPDAKVGDRFDHSSKLILVDRQGRMRGVYDGRSGEVEAAAPGMFEENVARLKDAVRRLAAE